MPFIFRGSFCVYVHRLDVIGTVTEAWQYNWVLGENFSLAFCRNVVMVAFLDGGQLTGYQDTISLHGIDDDVCCSYWLK